MTERLLVLKTLNGNGTPVEVMVHPTMNTTRIVVSSLNAINEFEENLLLNLPGPEDE